MGAEMDGSDAFDAKLERLRKARTPDVEIAAAIAVYERVRTAKAIAQALLSAEVPDAVVVSLAAEMGAEVHRSQGITDAV